MGYPWKVKCVGDDYLQCNVSDRLCCGKHGVILNVLIPEKSVRDLAEWLELLTANANVATVLGSVSGFSDNVYVKQC
jgi:hypothetical protein